MFKPGQSGNPGGKTAAQRKLEVQNAEQATRVRSRLLQSIASQISAIDNSDAETRDAAISGMMTNELLRLLKDSEERGFGAPKVELEVSDQRKTDEELIAELIAEGMTREQLEAAGISMPSAENDDRE